MSATATTVFELAEVVAAAGAAAPLVPAQAALVVDHGADGSPARRPELSAPMVSAPFSGVRSGVVSLVLDPSTSAALAADPAGLGADGLGEALRPALEAAATSLGPVVLGPVGVGTAGDADLAAAPLVPLLAAGEPGAWLSLSGAGDSPAPVLPSVPLDGAAGMRLLRDVEMTLSVEIGRARMTVRELLTLAPGRVVELDRAAGAPADLLVNGRLVARGEVVVVDEDFGLRITEILGADQT
ncbi:flagellar motor switch protein FliN [Pseudokineococcus sp. 1T1Z-3]|uniref:flagellar motor switch protein FliN n=1 Tax=Pseudokineococcus sp. 1T1Z-3 TaxID=3132745 RepID=UPI00309F3D5E